MIKTYNGGVILGDNNYTVNNNQVNENDVSQQSIQDDSIHYGKHGKELNNTIKAQLAAEGKAEITGIRGQHLLACGLSAPNELNLKGYVGDYCFSLNSGASIYLKGDGGRFLADTMESGEVIVEGTVSHGLGFSLYGGTVVVRGNTGGRLGQLNKGGTIIVDGHSRDLIGLYSLNGDVIITRNAGRKVGEWMISGNIYIGGDDFELGNNAQIDELTQDDMDKLTGYFDKYEINADPQQFTKIVPVSARPFYK